MTDNTQPEAGSTHIIRYALEMGLLWIAGDGRDKVREALDALDTLETQLASIRAGGVTGPLVGQPQAMPDLSQLTERGAKAWAGVDAQGLRGGFTAADMATASAQGFRDGVASLAASAGSEPVAVVGSNFALYWAGSGPIAPIVEKHGIKVGSPLYAHPSPPGGMAVTDAMIDAGKKMLHNSNGRGAREKIERIFNAMIAAAPPTAQAEGWKDGIEAVAKMLEKKADDFAQQHGYEDMGSLSFGRGPHADAKLDYHSTLIELADEVRAMLPTQPLASEAKDLT